MAKLGISTGTTPNDGLGDNLLGGAVKINSNFSEIYTRFGDGNNLTAIGGTWVTTAAGIHTLKNVGIGTTNPRFKLEVGAVGASGTTLFVNGDARITGIVTIGPASITLNGITNIINVGTGITINGSTGVIQATSVVVGGTTLTGAGVTSITAGSGISVNQSTGNVTITATGGGGGTSSQWTTTAAGIHTLSNVGIGTTNPTSALTVKGNTSLETLSVSGVSTFAGITTVTGPTLFTKQLNVSGVSTFNDDTNFIGQNYNAYWDQSLYQGCLKFEDNASLVFGTSNDFRIYYSDFSTKFDGTILLTGALSIKSGVGAGTTIANFGNFSGAGENVELYHISSRKFETIGAGVTVTGTTFTNQLSVSGIATFSGQSTFDSGIILSGESSNLGGSQRILLSGGEGGDTQLYNGGTAFSSFIFNSMQGGTTLEVGRLNGSGTLNLPLSQGGINISGVSTLGTVQISSGIVTATSGIVTYYGDTSNATDGRWTLGADGTSNYTFVGIGFTQTTNDPVLYLARGRVYEFVNNSGGSHPFQIRVSDGGAAYSDGVTNNGGASGVIRFEIPFNAPNTLYYQCTSHSGMGNTISVYPTTI